MTNSTHDEIALSSLVCSRLCHDLVSPVGAISNGIEILNDETDPEMQRQVMDLLNVSVQQTSIRLQFFRMCFGAAGGMGDVIGLDVAKQIIHKFLASAKVELDWRAQTSALKKEDLKLVLNLVLILSESLIRGGTFTLSITGNADNQKVIFSVAGDKVIPHKDSLEMLTRGDVDVTIEGAEPRLAPALLARLIANRIGAKIEVLESAEGSLSLQVNFSRN